MKIINNKIFKILLALFILGFILGIISFFFIEKQTIKDSILNYFNIIIQKDYNYLSSLLKSIIYNYKYIIIIWISGIILISFISCPITIFLRGIITGIIFITLLITFKLKGILLFLILLIPSTLINELIYIFMSYYSLNFSIKIYNSIKHEKLVNLKYFCKNYFFVFVIFLGILLFSSAFEVYISSFFIRFVV